MGGSVDIELLVRPRWLELVDLLLSSDFVRLVLCKNARKTTYDYYSESALPMPAPTAAGSLLGSAEAGLEQLTLRRWWRCWLTKMMGGECSS